MTPEEAFRSVLLANSALAALVGTRIRPISAAPDDVLPIVRYDWGESTIDTFTGSSEWMNGDIRIEVFATTYTECQAVRRQVKAALHNFANTVGTTPGQRIVFFPIRHVEGSDQDATEPPQLGESDRVYHLISAYTALFKTA